MPAHAETWDETFSKPAKLNVSLVNQENCTSPRPYPAEVADYCNAVGLMSSMYRSTNLKFSSRNGTTTASLKNLSNGKNVQIKSAYTSAFRFAPEKVQTFVELAKPALAPGRYEMTIKLDYPAGSTCDANGWCTTVPRYQETRYHQFAWNYKALEVGQTFKASSTKKVTKAANYTANMSATYTGKASYKATATATYKSKGKSYTAKASHTVSKTHVVKKSAKYTVKNLKRTATATKSATSTVSQAAANAAATTAATKAATKAATDSAGKSARSQAEQQAVAVAKKQLTSKVKAAANAKAKASLTKGVKDAALKQAKSKALTAAKKKSGK